MLCTVNFGTANTGASVYYQLLTASKAVAQARSNTGVTELVAGSGMYGVQVSDATLAGRTIVWDINGTNKTASETFPIDFSDMKADVVTTKATAASIQGTMAQRSVLTDVAADVTSLLAAVAAVDTDVDALATALGAVGVDVDALATALSSLDTSVGGVASDVTALDANVDVVGASVADLDADVAALAADVDAVLAAVLGAQGSATHTYTVYYEGTTDPIAGVEVRVTSDAAGEVNVDEGTTDTFGSVIFELDPGTYYFWRRKVGVRFNDPDVEVVS